MSLQGGQRKSLDRETLHRALGYDPHLHMAPYAVARLEKRWGLASEPDPIES